MKTKSPNLVNAEAMHLQHPTTFDIPPHAERYGVKPGALVKVSAGGERFWVEVTAVKGTTLTGRIDNDLVRTAEHGLSCNDLILFHPCNIYQQLVMPATAELPRYLLTVFKQVQALTPELSQYTCFVLAIRDLEHGNVKGAMARLRVDQDKFRCYPNLMQTMTWANACQESQARGQQLPAAPSLET